MKLLLSILVLAITLLGLIACGGKGDDWAIPEEYQNLSLDQLKAQSSQLRAQNELRNYGANVNGNIYP